VSDVFSDANQDILTLSAFLGNELTSLPTWIIFDGEVFTITPNVTAGESTILLKADDGHST